MRSKPSPQLIRWLIFNFRHERDAEAKNLFNLAYLNDNHNIQAYMNLQNTKNKMTARWHYKMLNDNVRNAAFKSAIQNCIRKRRKLNVIDIGSGTGLLSMYSANVSSVKSVYAIECDKVMTKISAKVFSSNLRGNLVQLVKKHSKELAIGEDNITERASLIVTETLDCGAFGEGILDTLIHAKENLLAKNGVIVPWKIQIHVAGYRSKALCANKCLLNNSVLESVFLGNYRLAAKCDEPYDAEYVDNYADFKFVTDVKASVLQVDFNDLSSMKQHFEGIVENQVELTVIDSERTYLDGFVTWFTLCLNEADEGNRISTAPKSKSCWPQAIFKMKKRVKVNENDVLKISMSCKDGVLAIHHELDAEPDKIDIEVDPNSIHFLNDAEYLGELEFAVSKHSNTTNCLDLTPFPFVGLMLLKEAKISKLYCRKADEISIKRIAAVNSIDDTCLEFLENIFDLPLKFDMILLHPFHSLGDLDSQIIVDYPKYEAMLSSHSLIVPHKITVWGELINSKFLVDASRVTDPDVKRLSIDTFINEYMTEVHYDLNSSLQHEKLTSAFKLSDVYFDNDYHEAFVDVPVSVTRLPIQAILFHHRIQLTEASNEYSTDKKSPLSCFRRCAQVLILESKRAVEKVSVSFQQNTGVIKCDVIG